MNNKVNYDGMKKAYDGLLSTFVAKNKDYGNSFEQSLDTHGLVASIVRMEDKFNRLKSLAGREKDALVVSESLSDTLLDLANYAVMTAVYLEGEKSTLTTVLSTDGGDFTVSDRFFKRHIDTDLKLVERNAVVNQIDVLDNIVAGKVNTKDIKVKDIKDRVIDKPTISFEDSVKMVTQKPVFPELTLVPRLQEEGHMYGPYAIFGNVTLLYYPGASIKVDRHDGIEPTLYNFIFQKSEMGETEKIFLFTQVHTTVAVLNDFTKGYKGTLDDYIKEHDMKDVVMFKNGYGTKGIFDQISEHHSHSLEYDVEPDPDVYKVNPTNIRIINRIMMDSDWDKVFVVIHATLGISNNVEVARNFIFFEDTGEVLMPQANLMPVFDSTNTINGVVDAKCDFSGSYVDQIKRIYKD